MFLVLVVISVDEGLPQSAVHAVVGLLDVDHDVVDGEGQEGVELYHLVILAVVGVGGTLSRWSSRTGGRGGR